MAETTHDTKRSEVQLIGEVRIAYPYHQEKRTKSAGGALLDKPRYDAVILSPKLGPAESCPNYKRLSNMAMEAAMKAWPTGWPDGGKWPIQDGDIPHAYKPKPGEPRLTPEQIVERNKWRTGYWVIEVVNHLDGPRVSVLRSGMRVPEDIPAQTVDGVQLYKSGDFGFVSMNAYTFNFQNTKWGVNFGYEGVAYTRQGDLIGGGPKSSAQMFAGIPVGATGLGPHSGPVVAAPVAPSAPPAPPAALQSAPPLPPTHAAPPTAPSPPLPPGLPAFPQPVGAR